MVVEDRISEYKRRCHVARLVGLPLANLGGGQGMPSRSATFLLRDTSSFSGAAEAKPLDEIGTAQSRSDRDMGSKGWRAEADKSLEQFCAAFAVLNGSTGPNRSCQGQKLWKYIWG